MPLLDLLNQLLRPGNFELLPAAGGAIDVALQDGRQAVVKVIGVLFVGQNDAGGELNLGAIRTDPDAGEELIGDDALADAVLIIDVTAAAGLAGLAWMWMCSELWPVVGFVAGDDVGQFFVADVGAALDPARPVGLEAVAVHLLSIAGPGQQSESQHQSEPFHLPSDLDESHVFHAPTVKSGQWPVASSHWSLATGH